jgi:hypothetical protein
MTEPTTIQALLRGGPADGAVRPVECGPDGPPPLLMLGGGTLFIGSSDSPVPAAYPTYALEPSPTDAMLWSYRYVETLTG